MAEPVQVEVIMHTGTVTLLETDGNTWWFTIDVFAAKFYMEQRPSLRPGDRVRITITKEPPDAEPS